MGGGNRFGAVLYGLGRPGDFVAENGRWFGGPGRLPAPRRARAVVAGPVRRVGFGRADRGGNLLRFRRPAANFHRLVSVPGIAVAAPDSFRKTALGAGRAGFISGLD